MNNNRKYWFSLLAVILLGVTLCVAGAGKIFMGIAGLEPITAPHLLTPPVIFAINVVLPFIELITGTLLLLGLAVKFFAWISLFMVLGFISINIYGLINSVNNCAGCFGVLGHLTPAAALIMDAGLLGLIIIILAYYKGKVFNVAFLEEIKGGDYNVEPSQPEIF